MSNPKSNSRGLILTIAFLGGFILTGCQTHQANTDWPLLISKTDQTVEHWTEQNHLIKEGVTSYPFYYDGETVLQNSDNLNVWQDENFFYKSTGTYKTTAIFGIERDSKSWELIQGETRKTDLLPLIVDQMSTSSIFSSANETNQWVVYLLESSVSGRTLLAVVNPENGKIQGFLTL
jgi:hypothetical protein